MANFYSHNTAMLRFKTQVQGSRFSCPPSLIFMYLKPGCSIRLPIMNTVHYFSPMCVKLC